MKPPDQVYDYELQGLDWLNTTHWVAVARLAVPANYVNTPYMLLPMRYAAAMQLIDHYESLGGVDVED